jgi:aspartate racemase
MKTIGVIGGMGPKATIDFLNKVISLTPAKKDQEHLNMIVYMNPQIPDRTEAILKNEESPAKALVESAKLLKDAGVQTIKK